MKKKFIYCIIPALLFALISCGSKQEGAEKNDSAMEELKDGKAVAIAIMKEYESLIAETSEILKQENDIAALKPKIKDLKNKYIDKFVAIGKQRETLGETEINNCNSELLAAFGKIDQIKMQEYYNKTNEYNTKDAELGGLLRDLNILTQYAQFELLKKQAPGEAARLGIK